MTPWRSAYWAVKIWLLRQPWWLVAAGLLAAGMISFVGVFLFIDEPAWLGGFKGNLVGEVLGGLVFLFLGFHFGGKVEKIIFDRATHDEAMQRMNRFIGFLEHEGHYDVSYPDMATKRQPTGLVYRLEPVRPHGEALKWKTEIDTYYVVRVVRPAYEEVLDPEELAEYANSPIERGGIYFCDFFNGAWHMGPSTSRRDWHRFELFGKQGEMRLSVTAQEFYEDAVRDSNAD